MSYLHLLFFFVRRGGGGLLVVVFLVAAELLSLEERYCHQQHAALRQHHACHLSIAQ